MGGIIRPRETVIRLPELYPDQVEAFWALNHPEEEVLYGALRCGRRWGKTAYAECWGGDGAVKGENVGWFAPDYKRMSEVYYELVQVLDPVKRSSSKTDGVIRTTTGGRVDFWTLEDEDAGRSRKYHRVIIDEAAFTNNKTMMDQWQKAIEPTLADYNGRVLACSNTNGVDPENFFYQLCNDKRHGFREYHAPSSRNPYLSQEFLARKKATLPPLVYQQEYLAEFVDWSGTAFFEREKLLVGGEPVLYPERCDGVFAIVDSAAKTGKDNDGTAVKYFAFTARGVGYQLVVLDWDVRQIEGSMLEEWLPGVFLRAEELARECGARNGSLGAWIEDKSTGMVLLQHASRRKWPARAIDSKLTSVGKDERAIDASPFVYAGQVKYSRHAWDKVTVYKEISRNHSTGQVLGFRPGDTDNKRADDLLDTFTYGVVLALGDGSGM